MADESSFTDKLGLALASFIKNKGLSEQEASSLFGLSGRGTLNTYTHGAKRGGDGRLTRRKIPAEVLARACTEGLEFEFEGYLIVATKDGQRIPQQDKQLHLEFTREVDLGANGGTVAVGLRKPPGKIALTVSLRAVS